MACRYEEWNRETHKMGNCQAEAVSDGLCAEHLEWVADCRAPAVSKLDMKYPYKSPRRKSVNLGASAVVETILEPGALAREYADYEKREGKNSDTFLVWFAHNIRPRVKAPQWTEAPKVGNYADQVAERQALEDSPKVKAQYARINAQAIARSEAKAAELERMKANDKKIQPCIQKDTPVCIDQIRKPTEAETVAARSAMDKLCESIEAKAPDMVKAGRIVVGTVPDQRPIGKRSKIDPTIARMVALCQP
jgi:hypothetical protein